MLIRSNPNPAPLAYLLLGCMWLRKPIQTDIWIDINGEVKVAVILSKMFFFFSSNLLHVYMFNMSLMNLQSIRICQQILHAKLISPCMHYPNSTISEHTKPRNQELPKNGYVKIAVVLTKIIFFSIIRLPAHVQYVCNESAKYQIASTNTLRFHCACTTVMPKQLLKKNKED